MDMELKKDRPQAGRQAAYKQQQELHTARRSIKSQALVEARESLCVFEEIDKTTMRM